MRCFEGLVDLATTDGCFPSACSWLCSFLSWVLGSHPWLFFHLHACTVLRETHEALFPRLPGLILARRQRLAVLPPLRSCFVALLCRQGPLAGQAKHLSAVARRTSATSDSGRRCILLTRRLVVSGHLSTNSALLIRSAEPVESSVPWSWQTLAPPHAGTRLTTSSCRAPVKKGLSVLPRHPRQLLPPTDLELVIHLHRRLAAPAL